jgi:hypothetical protein
MQKGESGSQMQTLFRQVNAEEYTASPVELQVIVQKCQQDRTTGLIQATNGSGRQLQILLSRGQVISIHSQIGSNLTTFSPDDWSGAFEGVHPASVRVLALPPLVLRLARLLAENGEASETLTIEPSAVAALVETWRRRQGASVVHFAWENAEAMLVLPEGGQAVRDVVFIAEDNIETGLTAYGHILTWAERSCVATRFAGEYETAAWADYNLHYAFSLLAERFLERYEQFTGRILVNAVGRDIAISAEREGWDISIHATVVDEQVLCRTLDEAAGIYRDVLATIRHHMTVVLGGKLVSSIFSETLEDMEAPYGELIQAHRLLPEDVLTSGQRLE